MKNLYRIFACGLLTAACAPALADDFKKFPHDMRICTQDDMDGLFKLREVLEKPKSAEATNEFHQAPHQYLFLRKTQSFLQVSGSRVFLNNKSMNDELEKQQQTDKRQYVLAESGALYFYKDGHVVGAYTCEIAEKNEPPHYSQGEMLLVSYGLNNTMAVKVYQPLHLPAETPPPPHRIGR